MSTVLLTGASGFLALHVLRYLLEDGHTVVATVRSETKAQDVLNVAKPYESKVKISYVPDISVPGAYDSTLKENPEITAVVHTASPFKTNVTDPIKELVEPAISGTTSILKAVKELAPQVTKVVVTSSALAIIDLMNPDSGNHTEENWNPVTLEEVSDGWKGYCASKKYAEKALWEFIDVEKPNFSGTTVNPPLIWGPLLGTVTSADNLNESSALLYRVLQGAYPQAFRNPYVDVRDVAKAHRVALKPETDGQRLFTYADFFVGKQVIEAASPLSSKVVKVDETVDVEKVNATTSFQMDNSRTNKLLGFEYLSLNETIVDSVKSFVERGFL
jgi:nucleoside-diphosphate-sugar epimerase